MPNKIPLESIPNTSFNEQFTDISLDDSLADSIDDFPVKVSPNAPTKSWIKSKYTHRPLNFNHHFLALNDMTNETLEDLSLHAYQLSKNVHHLIKTIDDKIPENVKLIAEPAINFLTNIGNVLAFKKQFESYRPKNDKLFALVLDTIYKDLRSVNSVFSIVSVTPAASSVAFLSVSSVGYFGAAAIFWGFAGHSMYQLGDAIAQASSPKLQVDRLLTRYTKANKKIFKLEDELKSMHAKLANLKTQHSEEENNKKSSKLIAQFEDKIKNHEKKIQVLTSKQEQFKLIALTIAENHSLDEHPKLKSSIEKFANATETEQNRRIKNGVEIPAAPNNLDFSDRIANIERGYPPSNTSKKLMEEIKKNQQELIVERSINTVGYVISAIGATLSALAPFCAMGAPAVAGVGIAVSVIGGGILVGNLLIPKIHNAIAQKVQYTELKKEFIEDLENKKNEIYNDLNNHPYTQKLKQNEKLQLYFLCKDKNLDEVKSFLDTISTMQPKDFSKLLKHQETNIMETLDKQILAKQLETDPGDNLLNSISQKTKQNIINRSCRNYLSSIIKDKVKEKYHSFKVNVGILGNEIKTGLRSKTSFFAMNNNIAKELLTPVHKFMKPNSR